MDIAACKTYEPLFGSWTLVRPLGQAGYGQLFEIRRIDGDHIERAVLKAVFIPRERGGIQSLMEQMGRQGDPAAFAQELAEDDMRENLVLDSLKGRTNVLFCEEQRTVERPDGSGLDKLMRFAWCMPLDTYLQQHDLTGKNLLYFGMDLCRALESCRQAGVVHGNIGTDTVFIAQDGTFRLGRFESARITGGDAQGTGQDLADLRALGKLLLRLARRTGDGPAPDLAVVIDRACRAGSGNGYANPAQMYRQLMELTSAARQQTGQGQTVTVAGGARSMQYAGAAVPPSVEVLEPENPSLVIRTTTTIDLSAWKFQKVVESYRTPDDAPTAAAAGTTPQRRKLPPFFVRRLLFAAGVVLCLVLLVYGLVRLVGGVFGGKPAAGEDGGTPASQTVTTPAPSLPPDLTTAPAGEPAVPLTEEEARQQRIALAAASTQGLCTGLQPQITDPATWSEAGKAIIDRLEADIFYIERGFTASASAYAAGGDNRATLTAETEKWGVAAGELPDRYPYLLAVNRAASTVTVYTPDGAGRYTVPYMAMACSGGDETPTGFFYTSVRYPWRVLYGTRYGQNATRICDSCLFDSAPYYTQNKNDLEYSQFDQLGTAASMGSLRLAMVDVKWIYDNCPPGTPVLIYDLAEDPGPMGKPGTIRVDTADAALRGWDPTDPDPSNPWGDEYLPGTAIRSEAAWEEYSAAMANGRWNGTINAGGTQ